MNKIKDVITFLGFVLFTRNEQRKASKEEAKWYGI